MIVGKRLLSAIHHVAVEDGHNAEELLRAFRKKLGPGNDLSRVAGIGADFHDSEEG
jgi:hypothetical protein